LGFIAHTEEESIMRFYGVSVLVVTLIVAFSAAGTAEQPREKDEKDKDSELGKLLIGKWQLASKGVATKLTFAKDQTWAIEIAGKGPDGKVLDRKASGTWKVVNGEIETTLKKSTDPKEAVGSVERSEIVAVDDSVLKIQVKAKRILEYKRVK
jgi:hypothetical protein